MSNMLPNTVAVNKTDYGGIDAVFASEFCLKSFIRFLQGSFDRAYFIIGEFGERAFFTMIHGAMLQLISVVLFARTIAQIAQSIVSRIAAWIMSGLFILWFWPHKCKHNENVNQVHSGVAILGKSNTKVLRTFISSSKRHDLCLAADTHVTTDSECSCLYLYSTKIGDLVQTLVTWNPSPHLDIALRCLSRGHKLLPFAACLQFTRGGQNFSAQ